MFDTAKKLVPWILAVLFGAPILVAAAPTTWDYAAGILQPLLAQQTAEVKVNVLTATSTTATSTVPILSITNRFLGANLSDCDGASNALTWNVSTWQFGCNSITASASNAVSTSSAETAGQVAYWTTTSGSPAKLSGVATSAPSVTYPVQYSGTFGAFVGGTGGAFSLAFGTTTSNTWAGTQTFGDMAATNATTTGALNVSFLTSALALFDAQGDATEYAGASCTNQFPITQGADGSWTCNSVTTGYITDGTITGDDINSNIAGRSLTLTSASPDTLDADSELYTYGVSANLFATTTSGISTTTEFFVAVRVPVASTITGFNCYADDTGTSTIRATVSSNPLSAGTDILYSTGVRCGYQVYTSTSTFGTTAVAAGSVLRFYVSDAEPTGSRPRVIYPSFTLTKDD